MRCDIVESRNRSWNHIILFHKSLSPPISSLDFLWYVSHALSELCLKKKNEAAIYYIANLYKHNLCVSQWSSEFWFNLLYQQKENSKCYDVLLRLRWILPRIGAAREVSGDWRVLLRHSEDCFLQNVKLDLTEFFEKNNCRIAQARKKWGNSRHWNFLYIKLHMVSLC